MKALIIVASGFQDEEFVYPYYRMREEGWEVEVGTPGGQNVCGKHGVPAKATLSLKGYMPKAWDLPWDVLVIPGGFESPDRLRIIQEVRSIVKGMDTMGRTIGAICHGPWVLISAGIVDGRKVTGYESIWDDLLNAGADYDSLCKERCVRDGNLVTAQHYIDNGLFMKEVIKCANERNWGVEVCAAVA